MHSFSVHNVVWEYTPWVAFVSCAESPSASSNLYRLEATIFALSPFTIVRFKTRALNPDWILNLPLVVVDNTVERRMSDSLFKLDFAIGHCKNVGSAKLYDCRGAPNLAKRDFEKLTNTGTSIGGSAFAQHNFDKYHKATRKDRKSKIITDNEEKSSMKGPSMVTDLVIMSKGHWFIRENLSRHVCRSSRKVFLKIRGTRRDRNIINDHKSEKEECFQLSRITARRCQVDACYETRQAKHSIHHAESTRVFVQLSIDLGPLSFVGELSYNIGVNNIRDGMLDVSVLGLHLTLSELAMVLLGENPEPEVEAVYLFTEFGIKIRLDTPGVDGTWSLLLRRLVTRAILGYCDDKMLPSGWLDNFGKEMPTPACHTLLDRLLRERGAGSLVFLIWKSML
ncbi:hypothetical protein Tco_0482633 [Tanacetum coccineum]